MGEVERGLFLFPWRPEERDSSLGGRYSTQKGTHRAFIEIFLKNSTSLGQPEPPTVASNEVGCGCGQSRNKLLNQVGASSV